MTPEQLGLQAHPEGGWFRETWRAPGTVATPRGDRSPATCIQFLLQPGEASRWHRVHGAGEMWLWQGGGPLRLRLGGTGSRAELDREVVLGPGGAVQHLVQPGEWQAAAPAAGEAVLVGCVVSPGFDFADFELEEPS